MDTIGQDVWFADGEELAEGGVETFLSELAPSLAAIGIDLRVETISTPFADDSTGYAVRINGTPIELWGVDPADDPWTDCTLKPLAAVNQLLARAGRRERVAVFYPGGNEGIAYLLPLDAIRIMQQSPHVPPGDRPVALGDTPPRSTRAWNWTGHAFARLSLIRRPGADDCIVAATPAG